MSITLLHGCAFCGKGLAKMRTAAAAICLALAYGGSAVAAPKPPAPICKSLAKLKTETASGAHFIVLSTGQFHFSEGLWVGSPTTPDGLPPGDGAVLVSHDGTPGAMLVWTRGSLACSPIVVPDKLIKIIQGIKTGTIDSNGDEL
jgi:hypothetical protein